MWVNVHIHTPYACMHTQTHNTETQIQGYQHTNTINFKKPDVQWGDEGAYWCSMLKA